MDFSPDPIPEKVLASWRTADGKRHEQAVDVASRIPDIRRFAGEIVYEITDDGVVVKTIHQAVQDRNLRLGKTTSP